MQACAQTWPRRRYGGALSPFRAAPSANMPCAFLAATSAAATVPQCGRSERSRRPKYRGGSDSASGATSIPEVDEWPRRRVRVAYLANGHTVAIQPCRTYRVPLRARPHFCLVALGIRRGGLPPERRAPGLEPSLVRAAHVHQLEPSYTSRGTGADK